MRRALAFVSLAVFLGCSSDPVASLGDGGGADVTSGVDDSGIHPDAGEVAALEITTVALPSAYVDVAYTGKIEATGGTPPYTFVLSGGSSLPEGLQLESDGFVLGTATRAGAAGFLVEVTDSASPPATASRALTLKVLPMGGGDALYVLTEALPDAIAGAEYASRVEAAGGMTPYVWSIASGALPDGIVLAADGTLSGTPLAAGSASFSVQVTDASNPQQLAIAALSISVAPAQGAPLEITTVALADGTVGMNYSAQLEASGGATPYNWSLAAGTSLPSGLILGTDGAISGTPLQAGLTTFSVQVIDASNPAQTATAQLSLTISPEMGMALEIITASLPDGTVNQNYLANISATGGVTPHTFTVAGGSLPPGLNLAPDGTIDGRPLQVGSFSFSIACTDASMPVPQVASRSLAITVLDEMMGQPLVITTSVLADGVAGQTYLALLAAAGGTTPYEWALDPASTLPPGLTLSTIGELAGTPLAAGQFSFTVTAGDASMPQQTASAVLSLSIAPAPGATLVITTANLPAAIVAVPYSVQLAASGGMTPYGWSLAAGALPPGIALDPSGLLAGTATIAGTYSITVEVDDSSMPAELAQATLTLVVSAAPDALAIITGGLPRAVVGRAYSAQLAASGGVAPYTWTLAGGALPPGLTLTSTGAIAGTPSTAGAYTFSAEVTDSAAMPSTAQRQLNISVFASPSSGLAILNGSLPQGRVRRPYSANIAVTGGTRPYSLSIGSGALPPGVVLDQMRLGLTGTPTVAGSFSFSIVATDSAMPPLATSRSYTVTIRDARRLRITSGRLPAGMVNTTYTATLTANGGSPPYSWSITTGALPLGLSLSSTTGVIRGTPTQRGNETFTAQVIDTMTATAARSLSIRIR